MTALARGTRIAANLTLGVGAVQEYIRAWTGASRNTARGPAVAVAISGHTQQIRVRGFGSESAAGPWFLFWLVTAAGGTPINVERRVPGPPFMRFTVTNTGAAPTSFQLWIDELPEYRVRA